MVRRARRFPPPFPYNPASGRSLDQSPRQDPRARCRACLAHRMPRAAAPPWHCFALFDCDGVCGGDNARGVFEPKTPGPYPLQRPKPNRHSSIRFSPAERVRKRRTPPSSSPLVAVESRPIRTIPPPHLIAPNASVTESPKPPPFRVLPPPPPCLRFPLTPPSPPPPRTHPQAPTPHPRSS